MEKSRRKFTGEKILLKVEVFEGGARSKVGGERTGERVETEAESVEVRKFGENSGGEAAGECDGGEMKLDNVSVVLVTMDASPVAGRGGGSVPE